MRGVGARVGDGTKPDFFYRTHTPHLSCGMLSFMSYLVMDKAKLISSWRTEQSTCKSWSFYKKFCFKSFLRNPKLSLKFSGLHVDIQCAVLKQIFISE